jgi:hypothetical protein
MGIDNDLDAFDFSDWVIHQELFDSDIADSYNPDSYNPHRGKGVLIPLKEPISYHICDNYRPIPGYENYIIFRDGNVENVKSDTRLKHVIIKNKDGSLRGGPRITISNNGKTKNVLVSKILLSTFKYTNYDFINDKVNVHYKDGNPRNISLENISISSLGNTSLKIFQR